MAGSTGARLIALATSWALLGIWAATSAILPGTPSDEIADGAGLFYMVAAICHVCAAVAEAAGMVFAGRPAAVGLAAGGVPVVAGPQAAAIALAPAAVEPLVSSAGAVVATIAAADAGGPQAAAELTLLEAGLAVLVAIRHGNAPLKASLA